MVSQMASSLRGTRARIHVWIPSVSVLFVVALCLCTLVASIRDDSIGLLLMPIACALVCAGCRMRRLINTWIRRLMNTRGGSTGSRPTSPASLQAQLQGVQILQEGTGERRDCSAKGVPICHIRKIAQLPQQRMQVLRCQEFEPSFFAERQGLEVQTDRPRSKLIHKQIDRQPSTAFARTIFKYWLPLHPAPHRRTPLAP